MIKSIFNYYLKLTWKGIPVGLIWVIVLLLLVIKQLLDPQNILDTQEYLDEAHRLFIWEIPNSQVNNFEILHQIHRRTPFYPLLVYLGGFKTHAALLIQVVATIYLPWGIKKLFDFVDHSVRPNPILLVLFLTSYPLLAYYSVMSVPEVISSALIVLLLNVRRQPLKIALILTLLISIKPVFIVLLPLLIFVNFKVSNVWVWLLPIGFIFFWMYRGNKIMGITTISSITITNPYDYNRKLLLLKSNSPEQVDSIYSREFKEINQLKNPLEVANYMSQKVKESIMNDPINYLILHVKGTLITLIDPGRYDAMIFWNWEKSSGFMGVNDGNKKIERNKEEWLYILFFLSLNVLKLILIVTGLIYCKRILPIDFYWLLVGIMSVYLLTIGPVGSARYMIPVFGILTFFGGWGIAFMAEKFNTSKKLNFNQEL